MGPSSIPLWLPELYSLVVPLACTVNTHFPCSGADWWACWSVRLAKLAVRLPFGWCCAPIGEQGRLLAQLSVWPNRCGASATPWRTGLGFCVAVCMDQVASWLVQTCCRVGPSQTTLNTKLKQIYANYQSFPKMTYVTATPPYQLKKLNLLFKNLPTQKTSRQEYFTSKFYDIFLK